VRFLAAIAPGAALAVLLAACGGADERPSADDVRAAQRAVPYPVYWAGSSFAGLALTGVTRNGSRVNFLYGTCKASGDSGCALPLEIQTSSICDRNALLLDVRPRSSSHARGAVVRDYGEGDRSLEAGASNVTVFGRSPYRARAVSALRPVTGTLRGDRLPPPRYPAPTSPGYGACAPPTGAWAASARCAVRSGSRSPPSGSGSRSPASSASGGCVAPPPTSNQVAARWSRPPDLGGLSRDVRRGGLRAR